MSLENRARDTEQFSKIDVIRPSYEDCAPISDFNLTALQTSARRLADFGFALNQMAEIGIICLLKNKLPPNARMKLLIWWILDKIIPSDPHRIICSQFVYISYLTAATSPGSIFDPVITVTVTRGRPFPDIDWGALWKEYEEARERGKKHGLSYPAPPDLDFIPTDDQYDRAATFAMTLVIEAYTSVGLEAFVLTDDQPTLPQPNAATILPQDLADSLTFRFMGKLL